MRELVALFACGALGSCSAIPSSDLAVTPQRPTLSSDTNTTARDSFELELGTSWDPGDAFDVPATLKYGVNETTEVSLGWSPFLLQASNDHHAGVGDLFVGLRHRFLEETDSSPSIAIQSTVKLPTANDTTGLGTGELDASFAGILTRSGEHFSFTGFYSLDFLGDPDGGTDVGHSLALAGGMPLDERLGAFAEIAGTLVPAADDERVFTTLGFTYSPSPDLVFDTGVAIGLSDDAPDARWIVGLTKNLGRVRP